MPQPFLVMIAGPNGSGKTTLIEEMRRRGIDLGEHINPDEIAAGLEGSYAERVAEAQKIADARRDACIAARRSFSFETVMSHPSKIDVLYQAGRAGFSIQLLFIGTEDPRTNIERVALRVAQGGHSVPEDRIVKRWKRSMELLAGAIDVSNQAYIFDNSAVTPSDAGPHLILGIRNHEVHWAAAHFPDWVLKYVVRPLALTY